jgi:histidinol-phosphate aminotransferase
MGTQNLYRKELADLKKYVPGKPVEEVKKEYGLDEIIKLASNENPLGPSPKAIEAIREEAANIHIYPDGNAASLKNELSKKYNLKPENFLLGNGGEEVIKLIAQALINEGDEAIMASPSFALYEICVNHMGGKSIKIPLKDNFEHDFEAFVEAITPKTKIIFVCNPNNPTGNIMPKERIDWLLANIPDHIVLMLDEAYYEYAIKNPDYPESLDVLAKRPNTIILRTLSKVAGLAGIRVGYAISNEEMVGEMTKVKGVFNVNRLAQVAAIAALNDPAHIDKTVDLNYESLQKIIDFCDARDLGYVPSNANFIFMNVKADSKVVFEKLLRRGLIMRPGFLWGYETWARISSGSIEETEKFLLGLGEVLDEIK